MKNNFLVRIIYYTFHNLEKFKFNIIVFIKGLSWFSRDYYYFQNNDLNKKFHLDLNKITPILTDKTTITEIEPIYFLQDVWLASKIFNNNPKKHLDIASNFKTISIIAQKVPVTFVDIRPPDVKVENIKYIKGDILKLPFKDDTILSLSSVCVIEHIGLGRYGDKLNSLGSEEAIKEIQRVVKKGGDIYITVPVDSENVIYFNAHRAFTPTYLVSLFKECKLVEEKYIYRKKLYKSYSKAKGFGTGLYHFKKK